MKKVIVLRLGRWNHHAASRFVYERIWWKGYIWTPFCWMERRRKKPKPAELTIAVAITGADEFTEKLRKMEQTIESFGVACERAGEKADGVLEKLVTNYNITINKAE